MVTTTTADSVLKSYYLGIVSEQLDTAANPLLAAIRKSTADVWGKDVRKAVRIGVNGGVGAGTEDGALPAANGNRYAQFVSPLKNLYGVIEISDKAIRASANNEGAFVNLLNDEMDGLVKSSSFNFGRMLFGDGSGVLATVSESTGTTYTVDTVKNIVEGMTVDVYNAGKSRVAEARVVESVDREARKVTLSGASVAASIYTGFTLVMQNSRGLELTGLKAIFGDGDLYGLSREKNPFLRPRILHEVGKLTESTVQKAIDAVEESAGGKIDFIVCSADVRRALVSCLSQYKRMDTMELSGGYRALSFNGIPVVSDRFCPEGTMYLLNTKDFCLHQLCDWQWLEGEDGKILKQVAGKPVYTATLVKYAELMCYRPCGQAMLDGIEE